MRCKLICFLQLLSVAAIPLTADINTAKIIIDSKSGDSIKEGVVIPFPDEELKKDWKLAFSSTPPGGSALFEWIPVDDDINHWHQLVQVQYFAFTDHVPVVEEFVKKFLEILKKNFPEANAEILQQSKDAVTFEWSIPNMSQGEVPQIEIARVISTKNGIHRIAYTKKGIVLDAKEKELWLKRLNNIKVEEIPQTLDTVKSEAGTPEPALSK